LLNLPPASSLGAERCPDWSPHRPLGQCRCPSALPLWRNFSRLRLWA